MSSSSSYITVFEKSKLYLFFIEINEYISRKIIHIYTFKLYHITKLLSVLVWNFIFS
jgi:hypothetical protein